MTIFVCEQKNEFAHICYLCNVPEKWCPCGTSWGQGKQTAVWLGTLDRQSVLCQQQCGWYLPPPGTGHILSRHTHSPLAPGTIVGCVKAWATPCAGTMQDHAALPLPSTGCFLCLFSPPVCTRAQTTDFFFSVWNNNFKGYLMTTYSHLILLFSGSFLIAERLYNQKENWFKTGKEFKRILPSQLMCTSFGDHHITMLQSQDTASSYLCIFLLYLRSCILSP